MKTAVLSNVNLDLVAAGLAKKHEVFQAEGYGQWISYALTQNEALAAFNPKLIFVILDGKALNESPSQCAGYIKSMAANYPLSIIAVSDIDAEDAELEAAWKRELSALCSEKNIIEFPLSQLIKSEGRSAFYSNKMWYMGSIPYSMKATDKLVGALDAFAVRLEKTRKKVLVIDLDNTIWGGVIGEDGPEGIVLGESNLGAAYRDAQKEIRKIADSGILLAIVSKNNPEDAEAAFEKNPHMILQKDDFTVMKLNWEPKALNINAIAKELNLGLDSFVVLDDNPVERESIHATLPEVNIIDFPKDIANLPQTVRNAYEEYFWIAKQTKEDKEKKDQYKQEALRHQDLEAAASIDDYIKSLNIKIEINEVREPQYTRTVQLMNKTNQFNTNTLRMDNQQFLEFIANKNNKVYVVNVSDKYGDSGLVSILVGHETEDDFTVDNFLMSCRVMGRKIENSIVRAVEEKIGKDIKASYIKSAKNKPVENLWEALGFETVSSGDDEKHYEMKRGVYTESITEVIWI